MAMALTWRAAISAGVAAMAAWVGAVVLGAAAPTSIHAGAAEADPWREDARVAKCAGPAWAARPVGRAALEAA
ncbi:MAG: hypothetical protein AB1716_10835 [Planctomycetota bacterium]